MGDLGENAIDAKAKASLQILKELDQRHPRSNYPTHTTVAMFQASATQGTRDTPFASLEKAQYNPHSPYIHIPGSPTIVV